MEQEIIRPVAFVICDFETAGLGALKIPVEIALRQIDPVTLNTVAEWASLIDPGIPIPAATTAIHGITDEMVADAPTMDEFIKHNLAGAFDGHDITFVAHNVPFDVTMATNIGTITRTVCTLAWSRALIKDSVNHKLGTLREHFGFPTNEAHRAMSDVATTHRLLKELLVRTGRSLEQFAATKEQAVHTTPWGKHKGQLVLSLPVSYLKWLWELPDLEVNFRESVKKALKLAGVKVK